MSIDNLSVRCRVDGWMAPEIVIEIEETDESGRPSLLGSCVITRDMLLEVLGLDVQKD